MYERLRFVKREYTIAGMQRRFVISYNTYIMNENDRERMRAFGRNDGLLDGHMP